VGAEVGRAVVGAVGPEQHINTLKGRSKYAAEIKGAPLRAFSL